ncbi:RNA polymerase sigma factor [Sphingobacterium deserti]|uniref:RNA polymerase, sigma-24 subunit, ECF subfamily n=1 Tax=Sphingobacterium deserti TaxID=1229276 RepID=A0A0B8T1A4_9SPHI|nr:sigma-70 family RNA polymerase sigma factor [Sphingobacterium deserti]KGE14466.1 RNA polymerase, sigma-24 subunit, ECF subfamily [Sphingobacterium deserti]
MDDRQLLVLFSDVKEGNRQAFSFLYEHTWRRVYDLALAKTRDEAEAKDILQEIYIRLWDKREQLIIQTNLEAYLYRMTKHEIIRRMETSLSVAKKTDIYRLAIDQLSHSLDSSLEAKELRLKWQDEIAKLPEKQRDIYKLHYEQDYSIREIAQEMGVAEQTVKNQLVTANRKIRMVMEASLLFYVLTLYN